MDERIGFGFYHSCGNMGNVGRVGVGGCGGVGGVWTRSLVGVWLVFCVCAL